MQHEGMRGGGRCRSSGVSLFAELDRVVAGGRTTAANRVDRLAARPRRARARRRRRLTRGSGAGGAPRGYPAGPDEPVGSAAGAVMGAAARRPLVVGLVVGLLALAGGALALRLTPSAAPTRSSAAGARASRPPSASTSASATTRSTCSCASRSPSSVLTSESCACSAWRAASRATCPPGQMPPRRRGRAVRAAGAHASRQGGLRPGHVHQRGRRPDPGPVQRAARRAAAQAERAAAAARGAGRARSQVARRRRASAAGRAARLRRVRQERARRWRSSTASLGARSSTTRTFVSQLVFDDTRAPRRAQGALRLPVPEQGHRR